MNKLTNITLTLSEDVALRENSNRKPFALARGTDGAGKKVTVMTYVHAGIAAIRGSRAGERLRLFGTWNETTFAAMGKSPDRRAAST
jgi:hypothetical protein